MPEPLSGAFEGSPDRKWLAWSGELRRVVCNVAGETKVVCRRGLPGICVHLRPGSVLRGCRMARRLSVGKECDSRVKICRLDGSIEKEIPGIGGSRLVGLDWSINGSLAQLFEKGNGTFRVDVLDPGRARPAPRDVLDFEGTLKRELRTLPWFSAAFPAHPEKTGAKHGDCRPIFTPAHRFVVPAVVG